MSTTRKRVREETDEGSRRIVFIVVAIVSLLIVGLLVFVSRSGRGGGGGGEAAQQPRLALGLLDSGVGGQIGGGWELGEGRKGGCHGVLLRRLAHLSQALPAYWSCLKTKVASMLHRSKNGPLRLRHAHPAWNRSAPP